MGSDSLTISQFIEGINRNLIFISHKIILPDELFYSRIAKHRCSVSEQQIIYLERAQNVDSKFIRIIFRQNLEVHHIIARYGCDEDDRSCHPKVRFLKTVIISVNEHWHDDWLMLPTRILYEKNTGKGVALIVSTNSNY